MDDFLLVIGALVLTAIVIAIPMLAGLSFAFGWIGFVKWILCILTFFEFVILLEAILTKWL